MAPPLALRAYGWAAALAAPLLYRRIRKKLAAEGVSPKRIRERLAHATLDRPDGALIWFHGASVGETLSILPLLAPLRAARPDLAVLVTSGTAASAQVMAQRLPEGALHQFAPIDTARAMRRFHAHWRPDLMVLIESEIWPGMLRARADRGIPAVLLNARLSTRSLHRWRKLGRPVRWLMAQFAFVVAQTEETAGALRDLGARESRVGPNLKAVADPAPDDPALRACLAPALDGRPVWCAASTHDGEDKAILDAHRRLRADHPDALLILAPRHVDRSDAIAALSRARGFDVTRQSQNAQPNVAVHLVDAMGLLGAFYRLSPVTLIAGSFVPVGGHNPWEATCGTAILHGPHLANCATDYAQLDAAEAAIEVTPDTLAETVASFWRDPARASRMAEAAITLRERQSGGAEALATDLLALMKPPE